MCCVRYGNWGDDFVEGAAAGPQTAQFLLENFAANIGKDAWWKAVTSMTLFKDAPVQGVKFGGSVKYSGSVTSSSLADRDVHQIVTDSVSAFNSGNVDTQGLYFVLTSKDVGVDG